MSHPNALPNSSPMRNPEIRTMVKKALQRISRRLSAHPLTDERTARYFIQGSFAGEQGFGPEGLTDAELAVMWEDSVSDCVNFIQTLVKNYNLTLEAADNYLRIQKKRYTENVLDSARARLIGNRVPQDMLNFNSSLVHTSGQNVSTASPVDLSAKLYPMMGTGTNTSALLGMSSASSGLNEIYRGAGLDSSSPVARQSTHLGDAGNGNFGSHASAGMGAVPMFSTATTGTVYSRPEFLGTSHTTPASNLSTDFKQLQPFAQISSPFPQAAVTSTLASSYNNPTTDTTVPLSYNITPNMSVVGGLQHTNPAGAANLTPIAPAFAVASSSSIPTPVKSMNNSGVPDSTAPPGWLASNPAAVPTSGPVLTSSNPTSGASPNRSRPLESFNKIFHDYYRDGFEDEFRDIRGMLANSTFTVKSVRALTYPAIPNRFLQQAQGSKDIFSLVSLAPASLLLPQLFQENNVPLPSELTQFTSDTSALNSSPRRFIVVCDVIGKYVKSDDEKLFEVTNSWLLLPCYLVELSWPPGTPVME